MRKRTARQLRRIADRLDPKPARWYASAWQQSSNTTAMDTFTTQGLPPTTSWATHGGTWTRRQPPHRYRVLADYLTAPDFRKLRP